MRRPQAQSGAEAQAAASARRPYIGGGIGLLLALLLVGWELSRGSLSAVDTRVHGSVAGYLMAGFMLAAGAGLGGGAGLGYSMWEASTRNAKLHAVTAVVDGPAAGGGEGGGGGGGGAAAGRAAAGGGGGGAAGGGGEGKKKGVRKRTNVAREAAMKAAAARKAGS